MDIQKIEATLWQAADKLRGSISSSDYKYVVLGLIFLKYISDAFEVQRQKAIAENFDPEDRDYYSADNVFWVPQEARWSFISESSKKPEIGTIIDNAMDAVERDNTTLKGVLPKDYAREALDKRRLGELIDLFSNTSFKSDNSRDLLGRVYEYFMGMFADTEGKHGGEFYTPRSIVRLLVEMIQPFSGRVYDPACGSGGMFVQSEQFVEEHSGRLGDIAIYGQELNHTTWRLAKMNMAIRGIDVDIRQGDTLHSDKHKDLRADYILANPPFNISDWGAELLADDIRWKYGMPPKGNANFAWVQHFIHHLSPKGTAGFVLANGSMSSQSSGEGDIRKNIVNANLVDCIVTLPSQLFFNVAIPCCLWFVSRDRSNRQGQVLFIDGRNLGHMINRRNKELSAEDIAQVADTYHKWQQQDGSYADIAGFAKSAKLDEIAEHDYVLTPGRYVGSEAVADDDEAFEEKMKRLTADLNEQFIKSHDLEVKIKENLKSINHDL
ncbi:MAG: class I SAM-dependent DNA methyltransferase [Candidatus Saccharibacteria bacterium]